jgi:hypothetical protein
MNERPPKRRHGFIGMVENSKAQPDEEQAAPSSESLNASRMRAAHHMIKTAVDFNNGLRNLRITNPELYKKITEEQHEVADCRRRAGSIPTS